MNRKVREAKLHITLIKVISTLGIVAAVGAFIGAAWSWGLARAAIEMTSEELVWKGWSVPMLSAGFGLIVLVVSVFPLLAVGGIAKALESIDPGEGD